MDHEEIPEERIIIYDMHYSPKECINLNKPANNNDDIVYSVVNKCMSFYQEFHRGTRYFAMLSSRLEMLLKYLGGDLIISIDNKKQPNGYIDIYVESCSLYSNNILFLSTIAERSGCSIFITIDDKHLGNGELCLHILFKIPLTFKPIT